MKKLVLTAVASLACLGAFAQGKIGFGTDSLHLAYWSGGSLNGTAVNSDNMSAGLTGVAAYLYAGTSSSQLFLYSSTTFGPLASGPGKWSLSNVALNANGTTGAPAIASGSVFIEVAVLSTEKAAPNTFDTAAFGTFAAHGTTVAPITFTLGTGVTYPVLTGPNSGGTWAAGTFPLDQYGTGSRGAIAVVVPEPGTFALAGLGAAAML
ncbi:MAG TPA: hypothetical protein VIW67_19120, partial [Terriglobales bacterium]